jgi:hypothetical protein
MLKELIIASETILAVTAFADVNPLWDMSKDKILPDLQKGKIEQSADSIVLKDGAMFAVPQSAFPDQKNFTVEVTLSLSELIDRTDFAVMRKEGDKDSGFLCSFNYVTEPWWARSISSVVNDVLMSSRGVGGTSDPKLNHPYKFTVSAKNGLLSFFLDDYPIKKCFMEIVPNDGPMWIGGARRTGAGYTVMPMTIQSVKVYGSDFKYVGKEKKVKYPRGVVAGKGWALDVPEVLHEDWPKVLIYGDSISMGYGPYFISNMLTNDMYVYHCCNFVNGQVPKVALTEMSGRFKFDAIIFNNGLHSLKWTPDQVSDEEVYKRMKEMAESFKAGAPQAKIFYLMTTPHTASRPGKDQPVEALGDKNVTVVRLNTITEKVMQDQKIPIIDVYTPLTKHLDWASGDGYHWGKPAYQFIAESIEENLKKAIPQK